MNQPLFQAPTTSNVSDVRSSARRTDLVEVGHALESMRDAGFDLTAAVGEPIDNAIQANASIIHVRTIRAADNKSVETIAFADNGIGIMPDQLAHALQMGYSTRYGERTGLGRFGVGLKLATLSVARRLEVYSRPVGSEKFYRAHIDLDEVRDGTQDYIEAVEVDGWPEDLADMMRSEVAGKPRAKQPPTKGSGQEFTSGTLVIWRKVDRVSGAGPFGTALEERDADVLKFLARAYRKFIDDGLQITLNGAGVGLHDPLFLMDNPRIAERYRSKQAAVRGRIVQEGDIVVDDQKVHVVVSLVPEAFRWREGAGGAKDAEGKDIRAFQVNEDNEGRISILRNRREIYYDVIPRMLSGGVTRGDRYFAIEVSFPAELDEYFQVRHVKRGAEPVNKLRQELRGWLKLPVEQARKEVRARWGETKKAERQASRPHSAAMKTAREVEKDWPAGKAGADVAPSEAKAVIEQVIVDVLGPEAAASEPQLVEELRKTFDEGRVTLVDGDWNGTDLFEITHLNDKVILTLNRRHAFVKTFYEPISALAEGSVPMPDEGGLTDLARRTETAFDFLLLAYARAENMHPNSNDFTILKGHWALYLKSLVERWQAGKE